MTEDSFKAGFAALINVFPNSERSTPESRQIYWRLFKEVPDDIWARGVEECLRTLTFFPSPHDIGVACFGEIKEQVVQKCDPWRSRQNYEERIPVVTWQENMRRTLGSRAGQLEVPKRAAIGPPENSIPDLVARLRAENQDLKDKIRDFEAQNSVLKRKVEILEGNQADKLEARRSLLEEQAKILATRERRSKFVPDPRRVEQEERVSS